ncbi:MAG: hypothetical protein WCT77_01240 [Bacteroidota bacterium]
MEIQTLISHSAQLFGTIWKSRQPSDKIASEFFRSKKYIGAHDRRFISEAVFLTLRIHSLSQYCTEKAVKSTQLSEKSEFTDSKDFWNYLLVACSCLLAEKFVINASSLSMESALIDKEINIVSEVVKGLMQKFNICDTSAQSLITRITGVFNEIDSNSKKILKETILTEQDLGIISVRYAIPEWILKSWIDNPYYNISIESAFKLAESLLEPAPVCLRINGLRAERENIISRLEETGIGCSPGKISKDAIILNKRTKLDTIDLYKNGLIEVQDEGSQVIAFALAPEPEATVLDACAGAGGKSLHIASFQKDCGQIFAHDSEWIRLKNLYGRAKRSGYKSIRIVNLNKSNKKDSEKIPSEFDYVLVDAPCSGMGTSRRMPMQKWRIDGKYLEKMSERQSVILKDYSKYVSPGGILMYATCSLMPEENDKVVEEFLKENTDFVPDSISTALGKTGISFKELKDNDYKLHLTPSRHGCDGFFMARMRRIE